MINSFKLIFNYMISLITQLLAFVPEILFIIPKNLIKTFLSSNKFIKILYVMIFIFFALMNILCLIEIRTLKYQIHDVIEPGEQYIRSNEMKNKTLAVQRKFCNNNNSYIMLYCRHKDPFVCQMNLGSYDVGKMTLVDDELHFNYDFSNIIHFFKKRGNTICAIFSREDLVNIKDLGRMVLSYVNRPDIVKFKFCLSTNINYGMIFGFSNIGQQKCDDELDLSWFEEKYIPTLKRHKHLV